MAEKPEKSNHYVKNADLLAAFVERRPLVQAALAAGEPKPEIPRYIAECVLKIAKHLAYKPNFYNYSFRDDMISDGIETCIRYLDNFDPAKSSYPFSYLTQICWFAFIRRISLEKEQSYIKHKLIKEIPFEYFDLQGHDETGEFSAGLLEILQSNDNFDTSFFDKKLAKLKSSKKKEDPKTSLEEAMGD